MSEAWKNRFCFFLFICILTHASCTAPGTFKEMSFQDVKTDYTISSMGKSNKDFIDAIDIWGAKSFNDWQKVKQTSNKERGIFIFRYKEFFSNMGRGTKCGILVSVEVKRVTKDSLSLNFSNITHDTINCGWINEPGVKSLNLNLLLTKSNIQKAIKDF